MGGPVFKPYDYILCMTRQSLSLAGVHDGIVSCVMGCPGQYEVMGSTYTPTLGQG